MIRILIADDHPIVRQGLRRVLSETTEMSVDEAADGAEVLDMVSKNEYHVILLDISMPGRGGIDILKQLKRERPGIGVLILSTHPEEQYGLRVLKAGASGYLTKQSVPERLIDAIRKVARGGKYISPGLAERLAVEVGAGSGGPPHERLSDREYQVMCMMASGKGVSEIADELALSVKTISTFRSRILEKMNMKNNAEITRYAIKNGLVE